MSGSQRREPDITPPGEPLGVTPRTARTRASDLTMHFCLKSRGNFPARRFRSVRMGISALGSGAPPPARRARAPCSTGMGTPGIAARPRRSLRAFFVWALLSLARSEREHPPDPVVEEGSSRRIGTAGTVHPTPGMRARRCEIQIANRRLRTAQTGDGPEHELLEQLARSPTDRAADEVRIDTLQVTRRHHVPTANLRLEARREFF